ncbi:MAG: hypothetical protein AAGJ50_09360, partial [Pseudomonadota bacterium]
MQVKTGLIPQLKAIAAVFKAPVVSAELAGSIRAKQLDTVRGLIPAIMMAQLINGAVVLLAFWSSGAERMLGVWATLLCFICGAIVLRNVRIENQAPIQTASRTSLDRMAQGAAFLGLIWGIVPVFVIPYTGTLGHMALGIILAAMGFAGAFLLARIPGAAYAFLGPIIVGQIIGMQLENNPVYDLLSILMVVYAGILVVCIQWSHARFLAQLLGEAALREQEQLISLLLRDFEETTSD